MSKKNMSRIVENVISQNDPGYESYGHVTVSVRDTETNEVHSASVDYSPSKSIGEAQAEAIDEANRKF